MRVPGFVNGTYLTESAGATGERCINQFPRNIRYGGKTRAALVPIHGLMERATMPAAPGRGVYSVLDRLFAVYGERLCEVSTDGVVTDLGGVGLDPLPVSFASDGESGQSLIVTSNSKAHHYNLDTGVFTADVVTGATFGGQVDGFMLRLDPEISEFAISDQFAATTWDPTQAIQRSSYGDPWRAMCVVRREVVLLGAKTGDVYFNAQTAPFPFQQRPGATMQVGIEAPWSLAPFGETAAWVGASDQGELRVYWMNGYVPDPISDEGIEWLLQEWQDSVGISDAVGWSYFRNGHFYVLTFPAAGRTIVFDSMTRKWHERAFWNTDLGRYQSYRAQFHAKCFGRNYVCDTESDKLYSLSSTVYTDVGGAPLRRSRIFGPFASGGKRMFGTSFRLDADTGVGTIAAGQGNDPQVGFRVQRDGKWGTSRMRRLGKRGETDVVMKWDNLGSWRSSMMEVWQSDPVRSNWFDAHYEGKVAK